MYMKISLSTETLQKKLPIVFRAVTTRAQLPILTNFLFETKDNILSISATDLEIGIQIKIPAKIEKEGSVVVPAKIFTELISFLPIGEVTIEEKDGAIEVISKKTKSMLQIANKEEFPQLYEEKGEEIISLSEAEFKKALNNVFFAASMETTRPALSGVLFKKEEEITFVATDGYRLSLQKIDTETIKVSKENMSLILPLKVIREALSFKDGGDISFFVSKKINQVIFFQNDTLLVGRLIEAEFPVFGKIIPTDVSTTVKFDREDLLRAVKTCAIFAKDTANIITFDLKKEKIIISSKTASLGENNVEIEAMLTGEENEIAFNARYLLDALSRIEENDLIFEMTGPLNPGVFKIASNPGFLHLIMPIRV